MGKAISKNRQAKKELKRLYDILAELDPLSEAYWKIESRIEKLEEAQSKSLPNRLSMSNLLGNATTIGATLLAYKHEDLLARLPTKGLARSFIPKSQTKR